MISSGMLRQLPAALVMSLKQDHGVRDILVKSGAVTVLALKLKGGMHRVTLQKGETTELVSLESDDVWPYPIDGSHHRTLCKLHLQMSDVEWTTDKPTSTDLRSVWTWMINHSDVCVRVKQGVHPSRKCLSLNDVRNGYVVQDALPDHVTAMLQAHTNSTHASNTILPSDGLNTERDLAAPVANEHEQADEDALHTYDLSYFAEDMTFTPLTGDDLEGLAMIMSPEQIKQLNMELLQPVELPFPGDGNLLPVTLQSDISWPWASSPTMESFPPSPPMF